MDSQKQQCVGEVPLLEKLVTWLVVGKGMARRKDVPH
jgi:hypothetical protein